MLRIGSVTRPPRTSHHVTRPTSGSVALMHRSPRLRSSGPSERLIAPPPAATASNATCPSAARIPAPASNALARAASASDPPASTPDYQEFELASYYRAFTLTDDLDTAGISATLRDGVLRVEIPKSPKVQPKGAW